MPSNKVVLKSGLQDYNLYKSLRIQTSLGIYEIVDQNQLNCILSEHTFQYGYATLHTLMWSLSQQKITSYQSCRPHVNSPVQFINPTVGFQSKLTDKDHNGMMEDLLSAHFDVFFYFML